jgi:ferredoxin-type protein NapH
VKRQRLRRRLVVASAILLPITLNYFSPYLMTTGAALGIIAGSFILWSVWSVAALFFGRAACGWLCPLDGVQLVCDKAAHGRRLRRVPGLGALRYVLWAAWMSAVVAVVVPHGGFRHVEPLYLTSHVVSVDAPGNLITLAMLIAIVAVPALLMGRHAFCLYFCPFALYNIVGGLVGRALHLPQFRLRLSGAACNACGSCARTCQMSLPVPEMVAAGDLRRTDCIMCGSCADGCRQGVIAYGLARSPEAETSAAQTSSSAKPSVSPSSHSSNGSSATAARMASTPARHEASSSQRAIPTKRPVRVSRKVRASTKPR